MSAARVPVVSAWPLITALGSGETEVCEVPGQGPSPGVWLSRPALLRLLLPSAAGKALTPQGRSCDKGAWGADASIAGTIPSASAAEDARAQAKDAPAQLSPSPVPSPEVRGDEHRHLSRQLPSPRAHPATLAQTGTRKQHGEPPLPSPPPRPDLVLNLNVRFFPKETVQSLPRR